VDAGDAAELAELPQFLRDWFTHDHDRLDTSPGASVDTPGYDLDQLRTDPDRFGILLGSNNGELIFQADQR
jgi:hypothetical protein